MNHAAVAKNHFLIQAVKHWKYLAPLLTHPKNGQEYKLLVSRLDQLLDIVGDHEEHALMGLVDIVSNNIAIYEGTHLKKIKSKGINALKFLMESHHLNQGDLPEVASQGVMSEILNGKRPLNLRQIKFLAKHFNIEPATFIDD